MAAAHLSFMAIKIKIGRYGDLAASLQDAYVQGLL